MNDSESKGDTVKVESVKGENNGKEVTIDGEGAAPKRNQGRRLQRRNRKPRSRQQSNNYANALGEETDIASLSIDDEGVQILVELKKNNRGKFLKLIDNKNETRKHRIFMSLLCSSQMCDKLSILIEELKQLPPHNPEELVQAQKNVQTLSGKPASVPAYLEGRLKSESIIIENRRYYLDLKENNTGRFLSITLMTQRSRAQVTLVADGMVKLLDTIKKIINDNCEKNEVEDNNSDLLSQLKSQAFRSDRKMFYFDVGANFSGLFCRVSEVTPNYRTAITIPESRWTQFRDIMNEYVDIASKFKKENVSEVKTEVENGN
jgi:hypothetical protein